MSELQKRLRAVQSIRRDATPLSVAVALCSEAADALDAKAQEIARLRETQQKFGELMHEVMDERDSLRARPSEATNDRRPWWERLTATEIIRAFRANELGEPGDAVYQTGAADLIEQLTAELADYQANVSESMDRTIAYEAELKADRDKWRKMCQDGWVEVADGPVSRRLREDLASFMMSRGFATGHGDSHTDLLGELGPQIDQLRESVTTWRVEAETHKRDCAALRARVEAAEAQIRTRVFGVCGYLSGRIPELHAVDCPRLIEAAEEYLRDAARGGA